MKKRTSRERFKFAVTKEGRKRLSEDTRYRYLLELESLDAAGKLQSNTLRRIKDALSEDFPEKRYGFYSPNLSAKYSYENKNGPFLMGGNGVVRHNLAVYKDENGEAFPVNALFTSRRKEEAEASLSEGGFYHGMFSGRTDVEMREVHEWLRNEEL
ncbi:hypothetical protein CSB37_03600 [bacterium DOLZORAL124_38_8]|nr:MAG: hypothetical protein CSB37_03600 [bacterium DOLZORAL124_38_8]